MSIAEEVRIDVLIAQRQLGEVLDQVFEQCILQTILVRPLRIAEDAIEGFRVSLFDLPHCELQCGTDVARLGANIVPMAILGI